MKKIQMLRMTCWVIMLISVITVLLCIESATLIAYAEDSEEIFSNSDVTNYIDNEYNANATLTNSSQIEVFGDDPIINYIPKEYFKEEGQHLEITGDYGYYIYTFEDRYAQTNKWTVDRTGNMHSFVLVFNVTYTAIYGENSSTADAFSFKVAPLFQREYATLMPRGEERVAYPDYDENPINQKLSENGLINQIYNSSMGCAPADGVINVDGLVVPVPQSKGNFEKEYKDVNIFFLTDVVFGAEIRNEQDLNKGDAGYDVTKDSGSFMIGTGYNIKAVEYVDDSFDWGGAGNDAASFVAKKAVSAAIGAIPGVGSLLNGVGEYLDLILTIDNNYTSASFEYIEDGNYYGTARSGLPNTKVGQIEQAGMLYRDACVYMNAENGSDIWIGSGHEFEAIFEISGSTGNSPGWSGVAYAGISLGIDGLIEECSRPTAEYGTYTGIFNSKRYKLLTEDASQEAYIMAPDGDVLGEDRFSFVPAVTGFYSLEISGSGVDFVVTDEEVTGQAESSSRFFMEEGETYYITLNNTTSTLKRPMVEVSLAVIEADYGDSFTFTLPAGEDVVIGVDLLNAFTNVSVNGTGAEIVAYIDNNGIAHTVNHNSIDLRASDVERLVIEVAGNSEQTVTLAFSDLPEIVADGETQVTVDGTINYFKFVPQAGNYFFIYTASEAIATTLHTEDGSQVAVDSGNDMYVVGLTVGETYWLMLNYTGHGEGTIGIETISFDGEYEWRLDDKLVAPSEDVFVYEGKTYAYSLLIDGEEYTVVLEKENDQYSGQVAVPDDPPGEITISGYSELFDADHLPEVNLYYTIRRVDIGTGVTEVKVYLDLILFNPLAEIAADPELLYISETMSYEDYVDVTVTVGDEKIESFDYYVSYQSGLFIDREHSGTVSVNGTTQKFSFDCADLIVYDPIIYITGFVYDGYEYAFSDDAMQRHQGTFMVLYGKGSGTEDDPYYINCNQHYLSFLFAAAEQTVADRNKTHWFLNTDIDLSDNPLFVSIDEFYGELDGGGHTLSGFTIDIGTDPLTADTSFGWVEHNYGTIRNVTFADVNVTGGVCHTGAWAFIGIVAGINEAGGVINNVSIENANVSVDRNMARIGGLVGVNEGTISDCVIGDMWFGDPEVSMFSNADMGIICGENGGTVDGCKVFFVVINYYPSVANRSVGGIVGYCREGTISNCGVWGCQIMITGTDAGICPNIGSVAGHVANSNMLVNNTVFLCVIDLDALTDAQKVNCCDDNSRQYGYEG